MGEHQQTLERLVPPPDAEISGANQNQDAIRRAVATLASQPQEKPYAAHDLYEYSPRTASRFPIPREEIMAMSGLPKPDELSQKLVLEELATLEERRHELMVRIRSVWSEIQLTTAEIAYLEYTRVDGVPVIQAAGQLMESAREGEQYQFVAGQAENETIIESLDHIAVRLEAILKALDRRQQEEHLPFTDEVFEKTKEAAGGHSLAHYGDGALISLWKSVSPDERIEMLWDQMDLWGKCLKTIEELGGMNELASVLEPVRAKALALDETNAGVRERLHAIVIGTARHRDDERWLQDHYLGYHELLVAMERWLPQLKAKRRAERRDRHTEDKK